MYPNSFMPPASLAISRTHYLEMVDHVNDVYPLEGCGILAGAADRVMRVYPIRNHLQSSTEFEMDSEQQLRAMLEAESQGWLLLAIFHSHPNGPQTPSPTDVARAYYPESVQLIVSLQERSLPVVRAFTIVANHINEIPLLVEQL